MENGKNTNLNFLNSKRIYKELGKIKDIKDHIELKGKKGVYIIISTRKKFVYPKGESQVIYIGKSDNLYRRIKEHKANVEYADDYKNNEEKIKEYYVYGLYNYISEFGGRVFYLSTHGLQKSKNLEAEILDEFYVKYLALPVGNSTYSFKNLK